jgi:hypothetical protein
MSAFQDVTEATDVQTIEPLLEEVRAAETAWRDGELPPLSATDRVVLRAARALLLRSRHQREHADRVASGDAHGVEAAQEHTFAHRLDAGPLR